MRTLTKLIAIMTILVLLLCAAGCKKKNEDAPAQTPTQATDAAPTEEVTTEEAPVEGTTAPATEATEATAASGDATEATTATDSTEATAAPTDEAVINVEEEEEIYLEETDDLGYGPLVTVTLETYEAMSEEQKEEYQSTFSNQTAFEEWYDMAMMDYDMRNSEVLMDTTSTLNIKAIIEMLTGEKLD